MSSKFIQQNLGWAEQQDEQLKLTEKKLYLTIRRFLENQFNQALEENEAKEARGWRDEIEKIEMKWKTGEDLSEYGQAIFEKEPDEFSIEGLEKSAQEGEKLFQKEKEEHRKENPEGLIKDYEVEKGEIDVNSLPL